MKIQNANFVQFSQSDQGNNLMSVVAKSLGKFDCKLCMRERLEILKVIKREPDKVINTCNEIYGATSRHKPKFHKHKEEVLLSTDEHCDRREKSRCRRGSRER